MMTSKEFKNKKKLHTHAHTHARTHTPDDDQYLSIAIEWFLSLNNINKTYAWCVRKVRISKKWISCKLVKGSLNTKYLRARERANVYERASSFL